MQAKKETAVARSIWLDPCAGCSREGVHAPDALFHRHAGICAAFVGTRAGRSAQACRQGMAHHRRRLAQHALFDARRRSTATTSRTSKAPGSCTSARALARNIRMEGTPIVKDGVMYIATGNDDVFALDAKTGALIWEHRSGIDQNINTVCCGWDNRGVAVGEGKVFLGQLDGTFVALDAKTGKLAVADADRQMAGRLHHHERAALLQRRDLYRHLRRRPRGARQAHGARCQDRQGAVALLDGARPRRARRRHLAGAERSRSQDARKPICTAAPTIWQTPAIDPDLGLIYFSTGQPGPECDRQWRQPARRQSVQLLDRGAASRRHLCVAFPAGAPRPLGFRLPEPGGAVRPDVRRRSCARASPKPARPAGSTSSTAPTASR